MLIRKIGSVVKDDVDSALRRSHSREENIAAVLQELTEHVTNLERLVNEIIDRLDLEDSRDPPVI